MRNMTETIWRTDKENARDIKVKGEVVAKVLYRGTVGGHPSAVVWNNGKGYKPVINYSFRTSQQRYKYVLDTVKGLVRREKANAEYKRKQKEAVAEAVKNQNLKKGDLYYDSWGYDQTNYDYIAVLEVSKTGKTVKCQRTSSLHMGESGQSNVQEPVFCPFGDVFQLQVRDGALVGSYPFCHDGTGSRRRGYFSKCEAGRQYHETMAQFGH